MNKRLLLLAQGFAAAALLSACFGGGGDAAPPPPPPAPPPPGPLEAVPPSASQSDAGMASYLASLSTENAAAESKEPLDVSTFAPPSPDDTEPEPVPG